MVNVCFVHLLKVHKKKKQDRGINGMLEYNVFSKLLPL